MFQYQHKQRHTSIYSVLNSQIYLLCCIIFINITPVLCYLYQINLHIAKLTTIRKFLSFIQPFYTTQRDICLFYNETFYFYQQVSCLFQQNKKQSRKASRLVTLLYIFKKIIDQTKNDQLTQLCHIMSNKYGIQFEFTSICAGPQPLRDPMSLHAIDPSYIKTCLNNKRLSKTSAHATRPILQQSAQDGLHSMLIYFRTQQYRYYIQIKKTLAPRTLYIEAKTLIFMRQKHSLFCCIRRCRFYV